MGKEAELLNAIIATPDDNRPRFAYAQWLTEQRNPLGKYIRGECLLANPKNTYGERYLRLRQAKTRLEARYAKRWREPFLDLGAETVHFHRGLVEEVVIPADKFLANQDRLFALAPIRHLELTGLTRDQIAAVAASPHLRRLHTLDLSFGELGDDGLGVVAHSPHLSGLRTLRLGSAKIEADGIFFLVNSPYLRNLDTLVLSGNPIGARGVSYLANAPSMRSLRRLLLNGTQIGDTGLSALTRSRCLGQLEALELESNDLTDEAVRQLADSPTFSNLRHLDLDCNRLSPTSAKALIESKHLSALMDLDIAANDLDAAANDHVSRLLHERQINDMLRTPKRSP